MIRRAQILVLLVGLVAGILIVPTIAQEECSGAPEPRLIDESQGQVAQAFSTIWQDVGSTVALGSMSGGDIFDITGEPVCSSPHYWYPVTFDDVSGWATEGWLEDYWLQPVTEETTEMLEAQSVDENEEESTETVEAQSADDGMGGGAEATGGANEFDEVTGVPIFTPTEAGCPGAPDANLSVGDSAAITQTYSSLRPGIHSNTVLRVITPDDTIEILEGPVCSTLGPYNWYRVSVDGEEGWVTEGTGDTYWIIPEES